MPKIYLDHSATTPVDERVVIAMNEIMLENFGNPSSIHTYGRNAEKALEDARKSVAHLINCSQSEVFFTSGGTESDNLALIGYAIANMNRGDHIVISNIEHPAVKNTAEELIRIGFTLDFVPADQYGEVHPDAIDRCLTDKTRLVSVMHVNNEIGTINDIALIAELLHKRGIVFHTDAVQSFGKVPIDVQAMQIDMLSLSGHKIYGPKGIGALFIREGIKLHPRQFGGHQESGVRSGTENLPGIIGLGKATEICDTLMEEESFRLSDLRNELYNQIMESLDKVTLNGHPTKRLPGNLNLTFHGVEGESLLVALDLEGIAVSSGSACSSGSTNPSPILTAIGLSPQDAHSSLRITIGRSNSIQDINYTARIIIDTVRRLRRMSGIIS